MQTNTIRILAAVVDTSHLTLYKEDGNTLVIPQGDARIRPILDVAVPLLVKQGWAEIDLETVNQPSEYAKFEEASSGAVKLFRIAKNKLKGLFGKKEEAFVEPVAPMIAGCIPAKAHPEPVESAVSVVEEILQHAIPVASPEFTEEHIPKQGNVVEESGNTIKAHGTDDAADTIIAVVEGKIIPGMEKIKTQFSRSAALGSTQGMENFLRRMGSVINERKHSVEDLLKFMERGDLPVADDGCILIYKVLNRRDGKYVDCHSNRVEQWVGAYVCMDPSLVDHNRNNECSNGLHVARRGYVREFRGDVCVLAKVAPEDVIAVPTYDANKMRVCGYHIIAELTPIQHNLVRQNKAISVDPEGQILLGKAMAGQHIGKTHEVRITGHKGQGVKVTALDAPKRAKVAHVAPVEALANPAEETKEASLDPKLVVKQVEEAKQLTRKEQAAKLYADYQNCDDFPTARAEALQALMAYKKASKVSWEKLGLPDLAELAKGVPREITVPVVKAPSQTELNEVAAKVTASVRRVNDVVLGEGSYKERIQKLLTIGLTSVGVAKAILELKKKSKKGWSALGVSDTQAEQITNLAQ